MGINLTIEITPPLTPEDRDLLAGLGVMVIAIANRQLEEDSQDPNDPTSVAFGSVGNPEAPETAQPCGALEMVDSQATGRVCLSDVGHKGRHRFRATSPVMEGMN